MAITILSQPQNNFISLTDIARFKNPEHSDDVIRNWLRSRNTIKFLGVWERLNNSDFNPVELDGIPPSSAARDKKTGIAGKHDWG